MTATYITGKTANYIFMTTITIKKIYKTSAMYALSFKRERIVFFIMVCLFVAEIILALLLINRWFFSDTSTYAQAVAMIAAPIHTEVGKSTTNFVNELSKIGGLYPSVGQKISHTPLSVTGVLVSVNKDNIQVFEYPDNASALAEEKNLEQKYIQSKKQTSWDEFKHVYVWGNLVIYYMGNNKNILTALNKYQVFSFSKNSSFALNE